MTSAAVKALRELTQQFPQAGRIEGIFLRPQRGVAAISVSSANALTNCGLEGDRTASRPPRPGAAGKRQVTLVQAEHLPLIAAWIGRDLNLVAARTMPPEQGESISFVERLLCRYRPAA
jgi:MOSC domain-containing protein YiiM